MTRDHRKLDVFCVADQMALAAYRATARLPAAEQFGLQSQIRRAAVSVPANIVEGCARPALGEYCRFLAIATASAREASYLLSLARRLALLSPGESERLEQGYGAIQGMLQRMIASLERRK